MMSRASILILLLAILTLSCTEKRQAPAANQAANPPVQKLGDTPTSYAYPHPPLWKADHIGFYAANKASIDGSPQDCARCHNSGQYQGTPRNLSCAIKCHAPQSPQSPVGSKPVPNPPISEQGKACLECHKANFTRAKQHYPAASGLCLTCHTVAPTHATDKSKTSVTTIKTNDKCISCHGRMDTHQEVHKALTMKTTSCVFCHDPHGSEHNYFTKDPLPDLCLSCHGDLLKDNPGSTHGIIPGTEDNKKSCMNCHNPHSADDKPLLLAPDKDKQCLTCHDREYQSTSDGKVRTIPNIKKKINGPSVHPVVSRSPNCTRCHSPHDSQYARLLKKKYPVTAYEKYSPKSAQGPSSYELCFTCHDETMLNKDIGEDDTNFRIDTRVGPPKEDPKPGDKEKDQAKNKPAEDDPFNVGEKKVKPVDDSIKRENLHWFHVVNAAGYQNSDKGRSCFVCHDPHGSTQNHMIKTEFRLNDTTQVRIDYKVTPTGGTCANTCHSDGAKTYKRLQE